jgi:hypothetical protein
MLLASWTYNFASVGFVLLSAFCYADEVVVKEYGKYIAMISVLFDANTECTAKFG